MEIAVATVTGRPIGMLAAVGVALAVVLRLPQGVGWRKLIFVGFATAIAFSVGLFFSAAMFPLGQLLSGTQMGVLLSLAGAPLAIVAARLLEVGRFAPQPTSTTLQANNTRPLEAGEFAGPNRRGAVPVR